MTHAISDTYTVTTQGTPAIMPDDAIDATAMLVTNPATADATATLVTDADDTDNATDTTTTATMLRTPDLPATIAGDGRYVMTLLNDFCREVTTSVNHVTDAIEETPPATIDNFFVTFDREGILWRWDSVPTALHYELSVAGTRLALTSDTVCRVAPLSYVGTASLTATLADGSTITEQLSYAKPRPAAPQGLSLSTTESGILIRYNAIPADCIGIELTVGNATYRTTDDSYLLPDFTATTITARYYDCFGTGMTATLDSSLPAVTRFFAEQNDEWVDLSWDSVDHYRVSYVLKVAYLTPDWDSATTLMTTTQTHARIRFPQQGKIYFLIKAVTPAGIYSTEATYATLDRSTERARNVIITLDQDAICYPHAKTGLYYDAIARGLRLSEHTRRGEYTFGVHLPTTYRARNWLAAKLIGVTDDTLIWDDSTFGWNSTAATATVWNGASGDLSETTLTQEIAEASPVTADQITWTMAETLTASDGTDATEAQHADTFEPARWDSGLAITPLTRLTYTIEPATTFALIFHLTLGDTLTPADIVTLYDEGDSLTLRYRSHHLQLIGTDGITLTLDYTPQADDHIAIGISQTTTHRILRLATLYDNLQQQVQTPAPPITAITHISYHPIE